MMTFIGCHPIDEDPGATLNKLFDGANTGKLMLRIA